MSEKIIERINKIKKHRTELIKSVPWKTLNHWDFIQHPTLHIRDFKYSQARTFTKKLLALMPFFDKKILKKIRVSRDYSSASLGWIFLEDLEYITWLKIKNILEWLKDNGKSIVEVEKKHANKQELLRLTKCEKMLDGISECDEICEACGQVIPLGETCSCIILEVIK